jgi:putative endonuclease
MSTVETGRKGEEAAVAFLKKHGYRIVTRNYRTKCGELDIVARHRRTLVFIEVKARGSDEFGRPEEAVARRKLARLEKSAQIYLMQNRFEGDYRFEILSVHLGTPPSFDLIPIE